MSHGMMSIEYTDKVVITDPDPLIGKAIPVILWGEKGNKREHLFIDSKNMSMLPYLGSSARLYVHGNKWAMEKDDVLWPSIQQGKAISITSEAYTSFVKAAKEAEEKRAAEEAKKIAK